MNKILFVCYDGYKSTNTRVRCYRFSAGLAKSGLDSGVFSFKDDLNARYEGFESSKSSLFERISLLLKATAKLMKEDRSTIFYVQKSGYFALAPLIVSRLKGNRIILDYDDYEYGQSLISRWLLKKLCRRAIFCVAASSYLQEFLKQFSNKVYYIPTGVDDKIFYPKRKAGDAKLKRNSREIVFTWVGFVVDRDAADNLLAIISAFDKITGINSSIRLEIVGGGVMFDEITSKISSLANRNIIYRGVMPPDSIPEYLDTVDVGLFILTKSTKYNRSKSPTKLFEYMAKGLAIISSPVGESKKIIADGKNGLIASNSAELIKKALMLAKDRKLIHKLGVNALRAAREKYTLSVLGKQLAAIIQEETSVSPRRNR